MSRRLSYRLYVMSSFLPPLCHVVFLTASYVTSFLPPLCHVFLTASMSRRLSYRLLCHVFLTASMSRLSYRLYVTSSFLPPLCHVFLTASMSRLSYRLYHTMSRPSYRLYFTSLPYTDTGPTSPSADPVSTGARQGGHCSTSGQVTGMTHEESGLRTQTCRSRGGRLIHLANEAVRSCGRCQPPVREIQGLVSC